MLNLDIRNQNNETIGRLADIEMKLNGEIYPKAVALIIRHGRFLKKFAKIEWDDILKLDDYAVKVKTKKDMVVFSRQRPKADFTLCKDILDQQIVDTDNRKVVRVNDIHMLRVDQNLYLAHVDVGLRGIVRRLGVSFGVDLLVRLLRPKSGYLTQEEFISWKNTHALSLLGRTKNVLRLDVERQKISQIPSTELADIIEDLDIFEKTNLFKSLDVSLQAKVFADMTTAQKAELVEKLNDLEVVKLLENIPSDEAADLLLRLPTQQAKLLMTSMQVKISKKLRTLLEFSRNSAGGLMTMEYLTVTSNNTVEEALNKIKENVQFLQNIFTIYIVDERNHLEGITSLRNLLGAKSSATMMQVAYPKKVFVRTDDQIEQIALLLEKYKLSAIPVVNDEDILQGVVTIDDVLEELIALVWRKYREKI